MKKRTFYWLQIIVAATLLGLVIGKVVEHIRFSDDEKAKYIFLFIGDGMSINQLAMTESWLSYKAGKVGGETLTMTSLPVFGLSSTYTAENQITCSAAAGTAISCGVKTSKGRIATDPEGNRLKSISYVLQEEGYNIALLSACPINHATEAAFYASNISRKNAYEITKAIPSSGFNFFAGSGFIDFYGKDGKSESSAEFLERNGYKVCCGAKEYEEAAKTGEKIVFYQECFRNRSASDYKINGKKAEGEVSLPQMLRYGLECIGDDKPFFIMCEGGTIDWAAHLNKTMPTINCIIEFDEAIATAYEFYQKHPDETLIVVTSDHSTGGVSLGCRSCGKSAINWEIMENAWNEAGQCNELNEEDNRNLNCAANIGWCTPHHNGGYVPVFAIGKGAGRFSGRMDNTEIKGKILAEDN